MINIVELDGLFAQYGYTLQEQREACRVYLLRQGMYYGAEIVIFDGRRICGTGTFIHPRYAILSLKQIA